MFGKTGPSPEQQALQQISQQLAEVGREVQITQLKVDSLRVFVAVAFDQLDRRLNTLALSLSHEFERLNWKVDQANGALSVLLTGPLNQCRNADISPLGTWADYVTAYQANAATVFRPCLQALAKLLGDTEANRMAAFDLYLQSPGPKQVLAESEIRTVFQPAQELLCRSFGLAEVDQALSRERAVATCATPDASRNPFKRTIAWLQAPANAIDDRWEIAKAARLIGVDSLPLPSSAMSNRLDDGVVLRTGRELLRLLPFFEIGAAGSFTPSPTPQAYLALGNNVRAQRLVLTQRYLDAMTRAVNASIGQLVLESGAPLLERMDILLQGAEDEPGQRALALQIIDRNPLASYNFAVFTLRRVLGVREDGSIRPCTGSVAEPCFNQFRSLFEAIDQTPAGRLALSDLQKLLEPAAMSVQEINGVPRLTSPRWRMPDGRAVSLLVPNLTGVLEGRIAYPGTLARLLTLRSELIAARVGTSTINALTKEPELTEASVRLMLVESAMANTVLVEHQD